MLADDPRAIVGRLDGEERVLLLGRTGSGKSTLAGRIALAATALDRECSILDADPGSPAFGIPGTVCLGRWRPTGWQRDGVAPLCTLDAGRFRLPLVDGVDRLLREAPAGLLIVDAPGVVRGVAGAELLDGLIRAAAIDLVFVLQRDGQPLPLVNELHGLGVPVSRIPISSEAIAVGKPARARARSSAWNDYLRHGRPRTLNLRALRCTGTPPPGDVPRAWQGRQVALLRERVCLGIGEVTGLEGDALEARIVGDVHDADTLLVRDAVRGRDGLLRTAAPFGTSVGFVPPPDALPTTDQGAGGLRPVARVGPVTATLINGVCGDPLLHVRFRHRRRSLLFDLGEGSRLSARIAHQVTDVFISHAHIDHVAGFLWLLRSRIGEASTCRIFGPPGITANIAGFIAGVHWDRIGESGPRFEVAELDGECVSRSDIRAGRADVRTLAEARAPDGVLLREPDFTIRATTLDHRTPVLAFALEPTAELKVRKERLAALCLEPGPWLTTLKASVSAGRREAAIELPDASIRTAGQLAEALLLVQPGRKLVYATDVADTVDNRERLHALASGAHTLFCEAAFCASEAQQADLSGHLTARACGEIASRAVVGHLIPFHFSRRYDSTPGRVYAEVSAACSATVIPPGVDLGEAAAGP